MRYVNLFSSCLGLVRENQSSRPVFSAFSGLARLFLPLRPAIADFSFLFPSCNGILGSHKSFLLLWTRNKTDKLLRTSITPDKYKRLAIYQTVKTFHPLDYKNIAPVRQKKQPAHFTPAVRTFSFSKFYFSAGFSSFYAVAVCTAAMPSPKTIVYSQSGLTP